jgi:pilus assembly protein FimV
MQRVFLQFVVGAAVLATAATATAMGFGRTVTRTTLGEPLDFVAGVMLDADETIPRECVFADVFAGDARIPAANVRAVLEPAADGALRNIRVTTATRVDEPIVTIEISVGCTSRMSRRFVAFIDPPAVRLAETSPPAEAVPPPATRRDPQSMLLSDIARSADVSRQRGAPDAATGSASAGAPAHRVVRHGPKGQRVAVARSAPQTGARTRPHARLASRSPHGVARTALVASGGGARLRLEPPGAIEAPRAAASAPVAATEAALAPLPPPLAEADAASAALQREYERIQVLEAGLASLRRDSLATQRTVAALQARLREAEHERYANGLVYSLAAAALLFALVAAGLWWLRPRQRRRARWFDAAASERARAARAPGRDAPVSRAPEPPPLTEPPVTWHSRSGSALGAVTAPAAIGGLEVTTVLGPEFARPGGDAARAGAAKKGGELSMEELIDLEQQAEFFVVLGQEEAALSLLDGYMRSEGGKSPLPYLQLLELHQRRGDRPAYERVREAFNARFQAFAPEWSDDIHFGRDVEEYPQTIARLQSLWPTPLSAMQALDSLLFRRHASDDTFDFPAYRELLFLYSIARELSGHVETDFGSIDVLLPLEDATIDLTPTTPDAGAFAVDLDVSSWPVGSAQELVIRRSPGRRGAA